MIIGVDLDGTISRLGFYNPNIRLPWWLFVALIPLILLIGPKKKAVDKLKEMKILGHRIIVVSARPPWATKLTTKWLIFHRVSFDKIFCIGFGKGTVDRKLGVIKKEGINFFFDDSAAAINFFKKNFVVATHL